MIAFSLTDARARLFRSNRRGLTLIEAALVLGLLAMVLGGLAVIMSDASENIKARQTAERMRNVADAAEKYITANSQTLKTAAAGGSVLVPITGAGNIGPGGLPSLQGAGFLPSTFVNINAYEQAHALIVRVNSSQFLEAIVTTTGGMTIPDRQLGRIAYYVGAQGGFIQTNPVNGSEAGKITGVAGGWLADPGTFSAGGVVPAAGEIMANLNINDNAITGDFLYRRDVGNPEANRMRTTLYMGANAISEVTRLNADTTGGNTAVSIGPDLTVDNTITAGTDITAGNNVYAMNDVDAGNNVQAQADVTAGQDLHVGGTAYINGRSIVYGDSYANRFVDNNDSSKLVVPSGSSVLNDLSLNTLNLSGLMLYDSSGVVTAVGSTPSAATYSLGDLLSFDRAEQIVQASGSDGTTYTIDMSRCRSNETAMIEMIPNSFNGNYSFTASGPASVDLGGSGSATVSGSVNVYSFLTSTHSGSSFVVSANIPGSWTAVLKTYCLVQ